MSQQFIYFMRRVFCKISQKSIR